MLVKICTWHDTLTPESIEDGDYAENGVDWRENAYDTLVAAAAAYVHACRDIGATIPADPLDDVAYADDDVENYSDGSRDCHRAALRIDRRMGERRRTVLKRLIARYARLDGVRVDRPYRPRPTLALVVGGN